MSTNIYTQTYIHNIVARLTSLRKNVHSNFVIFCWFLRFHCHPQIEVGVGGARTFFLLPSPSRTLSFYFSFIFYFLINWIHMWAKSDQVRWNVYNISLNVFQVKFANFQISKILLKFDKNFRVFFVTITLLFKIIFIIKNYGSN